MNESYTEEGAEHCGQIRLPCVFVDKRSSQINNEQGAIAKSGMSREIVSFRTLLSYEDASSQFRLN